MKSYFQKVKIVNTLKLLSKFSLARFARLLKLQKNAPAAGYFQAFPLVRGTISPKFSRLRRDISRFPLVTGTLDVQFGACALRARVEIRVRRNCIHFADL